MAEIALSDLLAVALAGITLGSLYCLMSMGLTLQFSTLGLFNFSHASIIMLGAFTTWALFAASGVSYVVAFGLAVAVAFGLGAVIHRTVIRPLETRAGELVAVIVATLGVNVLLENSVLVTAGARLRRIPYPVEGGISLGGAFLDYHRLLIMSTAIAILVAMGWMLRRTRVGLAMRAIAQDREAAAYAGIPIDRTYLFIVALASALAAVAGAFYGSIVFITPDMGLEPLTKAFLICVFGGLTSVKGTVVSAYAIGVLESFTALAVGLYWVPVVLFVFMMVVMVVRPFGLFGERF